MKKYLLVIGLILGISLLTACGDNKEAETTVSSAEPETQIPEEETNVSDNDENLIEQTDETTEENGDSIETTPEEIQTEPEIDLTGKALNPLTGLYIDEEAALRRPFGIMINNHKKAYPHSGIAQADVLYETLVEGGICRLYAVFQDFDAQKIGPVRSARHYFLDFAFDFDAYYVHYGMSPQADVAISSLNAPNLNGLSYLDTIMCFQDPDRKRPHSTYTSLEGLLAAAESKGYRSERDETLESKFTFSETLVTNDEGVTATYVGLDYIAPSVLKSYGWIDEKYAWFEYNESTGLYDRFTFEAPHIDVETGEQLAFTNIIVQMTNMWKIPGDSEGRLDMALVSSGEGFYITKGKSVPITWEKKSHYEPTIYYDMNGEVLLMNPGKTFISVFPDYRPEGLVIQ